MSEEQLTALLAKLNDDARLQDKLKGAADLDAALQISKEAGFVVSKADWLRHQANQTLQLSDSELEAMAGGRITDPNGIDSICVPACHDMHVSKIIICNSNKGNWGSGMCND